MPTTTRPRADAAAGARAMLPLLLGVMPLGLVVGVALAPSGVPTTVASTVLIYSGSAQLAAADLVGAGAPVAMVVLTVLLMNARLAMYSAATARHWRHLPLWRQALFAALLVDPSFVVGVEGYERRRGHAYYLGGAVVLWCGWQTAVVVGVVAGAVVPESVGLDFMATLYLVALVATKLGDAVTRVCVAASAAAAVAATFLPFHVGAVLGIVAGVAAASLYRYRRSA
ncbi:AzlC family ABC transporter permease [Virgisporangium ochraceum]